jgi:hypothetical protein
LHAQCADNDYEAVQAWLALHESSATKRAYRKEAERLILWAIVERGRALSSLTTEDATAYRGFLRNPSTTQPMGWATPDKILSRVAAIRRRIVATLHGLRVDRHWRNVSLAD